MKIHLLGVGDEAPAVLEDGGRGPGGRVGPEVRCEPEDDLPLAHQYGGLSASDVMRLKQLEEENRKLKQMVAELSLDKHMLQDVLRKKA